MSLSVSVIGQTNQFMEENRLHRFLSRVMGFVECHTLFCHMVFHVICHVTMCHLTFLFEVCSVTV